MFLKEKSVAISRLILMSPAEPMPPPLRGSGARRVHRTTPSSSGYPEATPNVKGLLASALMLLLFSLLPIRALSINVHIGGRCLCHFEGFHREVALRRPLLVAP